MPRGGQRLPLLAIVCAMGVWWSGSGPFECHGDEPAVQAANTAAPGQPTDGKSAALPDPVRTLLSRYCHACHTAPEPQGEWQIDELSADFSTEGGRRRWRTVADRLQTGVMPPPGEPRPSAADVRTTLDWIAARASESVPPTPAGVRRGLRRMSHGEYVNTLRDLLEVDIDLSDLFPTDSDTTGFDNQATSLHLSAPLLENYLQAAERALDAAIAARPQPATQRRRFDIKQERTVKPSGSVYRHVDDGVAIFSSWVSANIQVTLWQFQTRERGPYRFRISGYGYQTERPVTFHVNVGPMNAAAQQTLIDYFEVPAGKPQVVEFTESLDPQQTIRIVADGLGVIPPEVERIGADKYTGPGLVVQWVEIEGPLMPRWPPASRQRLLGDLPVQRVEAGERKGTWEVVSREPLADARRILLQFTRRAFRRPVTDADIEPFLRRVQGQLDSGASFDEALRVGLRGVLVAPQFLYVGSSSPMWGDVELASRLSYFLWSSLPDDELLQLAEHGQLRDPAILRQQVERLLRDPRSQAFTRNFAGQWLGLRGIDATAPDPTLYPEFDDLLKVSSVRETYLFFDELLQHDRSLTNFVAADFALLNGRLAKHYGIPDVEGLAFRRVPLPPDGRRGGVLTMASVLKVTANGTTTSPVLRGAWVLERILGTPPPKPSLDVEAVEPDIRGATTIRQQLARHRDQSACAGCHALIDPPGFALENYDVIGGWRDHYRSVGAGTPVEIEGRRRRYRHGPAVEAADVLIDGRSFRDIGAFKQLLLADPDQLARALTEKLLAYATGAPPAWEARGQINQILARVRDRDYGFRSLIHEIVQSELFQQRGG
ncbi:MAG: DUF1592 domain-containing protein [Pirellulales bacterium]